METAWEAILYQSGPFLSIISSPQRKRVAYVTLDLMATHKYIQIFTKQPGPPTYHHRMEPRPINKKK